MFGIKKQLIKSFIKLVVVENKPNFLKIQINKLQDIDEKYKAYDQEIITAIKLLQGVEDVQIDYTDNIVTIIYDGEVVSPQKIYNWLQAIIDVSLDYLEFIEKYWETNIDLVREKMQQVLKDRVKDFNTIRR